MLSFIFKKQSYSTGTKWTVILNAFSKLIQFILILLVGKFVGNNNETDIYFTLIAFITQLSFMGGFIVNDVLAPEIINISKNKPEQLYSFIIYFFQKYIYFGVFIAIVFFLFPSQVLTTLTKFNIETINRYLSLCTYFGVLFLLMLIFNFTNNLLFSQRLFILPLVLNIITNSLAIFTFMFYQKEFGIKSILIGLIIGYTFSIFTTLSLLKKIFIWANIIGQKFKLTKKMKKDILSCLLYSVLNIVGYYIPFYILSGFGTGYASSYNIALQIIYVPLQFVVIQVAAIFGTQANHLISINEESNMIKLYFITVKKILVFILPLCIFISFTSDHILTRLNMNTGYTSLILNFIVWTVPVNSFNIITHKLVTAKGKVSDALWVPVVYNILLIIGLYFVSYFHDITIFLVAYNILYNFYLVLIFIFLRKINIKFEINSAHPTS